MNNIYVKLFNNHSVTFNGEIISFPYNKVQALIYYLAVNKITNRDELSALLWPDMEDKSAKKNLRNAIYKLKECFMKEDILNITNNSTVSFNPKIQISTDVDKFISNSHEIDEYKGDFLKGFRVKNTENYETWIYQTREYLKGIYLKRLTNKIILEKNKGNYQEVEKICKLIIDNDEFNEEAYKNLITCYKNQGKYISAVNTYDKISDILNNELSITPSYEIEKAFSEVLQDISSRNNKVKSKGFFYGRTKEIKILDNNFKNFVEGKASKSILIQGEMGIGKTRLKEEFIQLISHKKVYISETSCYQFEDEYILKPLKKCLADLVTIIKKDNIQISKFSRNILSKFIPEVFLEVRDSEMENIKIENYLDFFKHDAIVNSIADILNLIGNQKKLLIIFEDIQWMDSLSITILTSLITNINNYNVMFLLTCRNEYNSSIDKLLISTNKYNKIENIILTRFKSREVVEFINSAIPESNISIEMINKIYIETEGNTFFLTEYLSIINSQKNINIMTTNMQDILKSRFIEMSSNEKKIVEAISLFDDEAPLYLIEELTKIEELEIIDIIEGLEKKCILQELSRGSDIYIKFTHRKLREFQHNNLSHLRKNILHNKVAKIIENKINNNLEDANLYFQLIYHYENANNNIECLKYKIKSLNINLNFIHERFPLINHDDKFYSKLYFDENITTKKLHEMEKALSNIKTIERNSIEVKKLEISILHIKGRYLIRKGEYEEGVNCIEDLISMALDIGFYQYVIEGYKQMIAFCIQTNNIVDIMKYIDSGSKIIEENNIYTEEEVFLRFRAIYKIMIGEYESGQSLMLECIKVLRRNRKISNQYILHIAACYNDIGNIKMKSNNYQEALEYYKKSISMCEDKNIWISISLFETNAGVAAYYLGDCQIAKEYLNKAINIYKKVSYNLGESIAQAYMSLIAFKEENYIECFNHLKNADIKSNQLKIPREIGTVLLIKSKIKESMNKNQELCHVFKDYLNEDFEIYFNKALKYLEVSKEEYQISTINKVLNF